MAARLVAGSLPSRPVRTNPSVRGFDPARPFQSIGRFQKVDWKPLERGVLLGACWGEGPEQGMLTRHQKWKTLVTRARARVALSSAHCSRRATPPKKKQGMAWRLLPRATRREAVARANAWAWPRRTELPAGPSMAVDVSDQPRNMSMQHGLVPLDATHDGPIELSRPNFNDVDAAFRGHGLGTLLFSWAILGTTSIRPLVQNCEAVLDYSKKMLGTSAVEFAIKHTMFRHFCVDDNPKALENAILGLRARGVNSILDYAKEADLSDTSVSHGEAMEQTFNEFLRTMDVVKSLDSNGFTAIKVTALAKPEFLQKSSQLLNFVYSKFAEEDVDGAGTIPRSAFMRVFKNNFHYGPNMWSCDPLQDVLDLPVGTPVNYRRWCKNLPIVDLKNLQDVADVHFDEGDIVEAQDLQRRMFALGEHAADKGVRLLVDAEQTYFQRTMDQLAFQMQQRYNRGGTYVYQTYQLYLKNSDKELEWELREASEKGFKLGAKIVRGAYMDSERALAESKGLPSPIHDTKEDTDRNFNRCLDSLLREVGRGTSSVFIASHSQASIEHALDRMKEFNIPRASSDVFFGQLKGMADHLTFTLGQHGYRVAKLVPYGKVADVMPFLIRRAQENSAILSRSSEERGLIMRAFTRRLCSL